jgi:hypothetical protein
MVMWYIIDSCWLQSLSKESPVHPLFFFLAPGTCKLLLCPVFSRNYIHNLKWPGTPASSWKVLRIQPIELLLVAPCPCISHMWSVSPVRSLTIYLPEECRMLHIMKKHPCVSLIKHSSSPRYVEACLLHKRADCTSDHSGVFYCFSVLWRCDPVHTWHVITFMNPVKTHSGFGTSFAMDCDDIVYVSLLSENRSDDSFTNGPHEPFRTVPTAEPHSPRGYC